MHKIKSYTLRIKFIGLCKIIIVVMKAKVTFAANISESGTVIDQLRFYSNNIKKHKQGKGYF